MDIERGVMGTLPYAAVGRPDGAPVLVLAGLMPVTGVSGSSTVTGALGPVRALETSRRLVVTNRRPGLPRGLTIGELAAEHAHAIRETWGEPVDVVGVSTGGSIAQQLAADHPEVVRRLVIGSSACRLGAYGRSMQARVADLIREGRTRRAAAVLAGALVPPYCGRTVARGVAYGIAPIVLRDRQGLADMATTMEAEDGFDLGECASPILAPTLLVGGGRDRFYERWLFSETRLLIPDCTLRLVHDKGHLTVLGDPGVQALIARFLSMGRVAS